MSGTESYTIAARKRFSYDSGNPAFNVCSSAFSVGNTEPFGLP